MLTCYYTLLTYAVDKRLLRSLLNYSASITYISILKVKRGFGSSCDKCSGGKELSGR